MTTTEITGHVWELRFRDPAKNSNKFYRLYQVSNGGHYLVFNWGRFGTRGQFQVDSFTTEGALMSVLFEKRDSKLDKGYTQVRNEALPVIPHDILGVIEDKLNVRLEQATAATASTFDVFTADMDTLVRMITSSDTLTAATITLRQELGDRLATMQAQLAIAEGQAEMIDDLIRDKVGA